MEHDVEKLPKWAQNYIAELTNRVDSAEKTIPWTDPGMTWFTLFAPIDGCKRAPVRLYVCSDHGTRCVCALGENDFIFVGRGKEAPREH